MRRTQTGLAANAPAIFAKVATDLARSSRIVCEVMLRSLCFRSDTYEGDASNQQRRGQRCLAEQVRR